MLADQIKLDMTTGMKSGSSLVVSVLRMLMSELNYKQIDLGRDLTEEDVVGVIQKEVKKRREAIDSYTAGGRLEQAELEKRELEILQKYLPAQMSEEDVKAELGAMEEIKSLSDFGQIMKVVSPKFKGRADGALVARLVKEYLGS